MRKKHILRRVYEVRGKFDRNLPLYHKKNIFVKRFLSNIFYFIFEKCLQSVYFFDIILIERMKEIKKI